jgi:peptidoglycan/xylan/chitin deacetylase (PgdA/CDA1 family)
MRFAKIASDLRHRGVCIGAAALYYSGALALLRARSHEPGEPGAAQNPFAILLYHRVNPYEDSFFPAVSTKVFEAQMKYLARKFRVLPLADIIDRIQHRKGLDPLTIAVTFDDGYRDNYTFAHPILKKYSLPATIFVATGFIDNNVPMWNDRVAWALKNSERETVVCEFSEGKVRLPLRTQDDRVNSLNSILEKLKTLPELEKEKALEKILDALQNKKPEPANLMLDWRSLRDMAEQGWDIGSHTVSHQILTRIEISGAEAELKTSKDTIERQLQRPVRLCAFPNGKRTDFNATIKAMVKNLGFQGAVTTLSGINHRDVEFYELRRWSIWEKHLPTFACKLSYLYGGSNDEKRL